MKYLNNIRVLALGFSCVLASFVTVAHADDDNGDDDSKLEVRVAYADTMPASGGSFVPSLWQGSPNVDYFFGSISAGGNWHTGAVALYNKGTKNIYIRNVTIDFKLAPWTNFSIWGDYFSSGDVILKPGKYAILAQTGNVNVFDSSDFNPPVNTFNCSHPTGFVPLIHVTVGKTRQKVVDFLDTVQQLNEQGLNKNDCQVAAGGAPFNEGHDWPAGPTKRVSNDH